MKKTNNSRSAFFYVRTLTGVTLCFAGVALAFSAFQKASAQNKSSSGAPVVEGIYEGVAQVMHFDVSPPLREMEAIPETKARKRPNEDREVRPMTFGYGTDWDPVVQKTLAGTDQAGTKTPEIPGPIVSFDSTGNPAGVAPPDPNGSVGPNHVVTMVNSNFQIFTKTGTSVFGPAANNTLFAGFGGPCQTENAGDPIVVYDRFADRWFLSQFTASGPSYFFCIAISTTPDPTGSYYRYAIATGTRFPDYPKASTWPDAYYVSTREFAGSSFAGVGAYALNRAQALAGNPNATVIAFLATPSPAYNVGDGLLPADADGLRPPPAGSPNYFVGSMDNGGPYGAPQDALTLWKFTANFANPPASSFVLTNTIPIAAFDTIPSFCAGRACIPQPNTTNRLDHLGYRQRPLFRLAYRNFGTHESLVTNQSVEAVDGMSGIRWWEVRNPNGTPVIHQEGTFAPGVTDGIHRWMGAAAMDAEGNIALGYSAANATLFPSIYYTGRRASDPLGTMPQGEGAIITGTGSQTGGGSRWGDYTSLSIDPVDDLTFWHVNEYVPVTSTSGWRARVGSFNFAQGPAPAKGTGRFTISDCFLGSGVAGATVTINGNVYGSTISGLYDATLLPGTYTYSISKPSFSTATGTFTVVAGSITPINLCLQGAPVILSGGASIINAGPNGVIDPGETVTVALGLQNTNVCTTPGLTGTLQSGGGITSPSGAQNYGTLCGGNPTAFRQFTFTVDPSLPCGSIVTATLAVTDGSISYGPIIYTFTTGSTALTNLENFDGVVAPALPPGWTPTASGSGTFPTTVTTFPDTAPNAAFLSEAATVGLSELTSPAVSIPGPGVKLSFRTQFNTEPNFDGLVLEISVNGAPFQDIVTAGGAFAAGGYNSTLSTGFANPLPGRRAWSGLSGGTQSAPAYISTLVDLPPAASGQSVQFKWRQGSDSSQVPATNPGSRIDSIRLLSLVCGGTAPQPTAAASRKVHGSAGPFDVPLTPNAPLTGAIATEPRSQVPGEHQMVVTFPGPVSVSGVSVSTGTGSATSSVAGNVVTVNLTGVTDRQRLEVTLAGVSSDSALGSVRIPMGILSGDVNGNGAVSGTDVSQVKAAGAVGTVSQSSFRSDVNANGAVTTSDIGTVKARSGNTL